MAIDTPAPVPDVFHAAIEGAIRARFPEFATVAFYRDATEDTLPTPACLLAMTRLDRSKDNSDGTGQMQALLRFEARIIMPPAAPAAALDVRRAAVALATWLHQLGRFPGTISGAIDVIAALPDAAAPAQAGAGAWIVEWSLPVALGSDAWADSGGEVPEAFYSFAPDIGSAHEPAYRALAEHTP